jgi:uncharacterized protein with FMN-binding domain
MKTLSIIAGVAALLILPFGFSFNKENTCRTYSGSPRDTLVFDDGTYDGESQAQYTYEQFWGHTRITINNNRFTDIYFSIRDTNLHEVVDSLYGVNHYSSIPAYMQQCVNEDHAIKIYPMQLMQTQRLQGIDCITGATWSYNIFIASTNEALKKAIPTSVNDAVSERKDASVTLKPNPFQTAITMEYVLTGPSHVMVGIYDNQGRLTRQLVDEYQKPGNHIIEWDDCPSAGIYYCQIEVDGKAMCNKIIHIK